MLLFYKRLTILISDSISGIYGKQQENNGYQGGNTMEKHMI